MGGTTGRMESFANYMVDEIGFELPLGQQLKDIASLANRYAMYKVKERNKLKLPWLNFD